MNVLVLAAGEAFTGTDAEHYPTWLSEVDGVLLLERQVVDIAKLDPDRFVFMFREEDAANYFLEDIVQQIRPGASVVTVRRETAGAACTALLAAGHIEMDKELLVISATDQIDVDYRDVVERFRDESADAGALTFPSLHPRYSYILADESGWALEASEKRPISRLASTGTYWFRRASDFFEAAKEMILKDANVHGKFFICPSLNEFVLRHKKVYVHQLEAAQYHPLKSDKQVLDFGHAAGEYRAR